MNRLLFVSAVLLSMPLSASAAPAPAKAVTAPARPDLLSSVRSHVAALGRQPLASPCEGCRPFRLRLLRRKQRILEQ